MEKLTEGFYTDIPMSEYHSDLTSYSKSSIAAFKDRGLKFFYDREHGEKKSTRAMDIGSAFHCLALEPETFIDRFAIIPNVNGKPLNKNSKVFKDFAIENDEKILLTSDEWCIADGMAKSAKLSGLVETSSGVAELTGIFEHSSGIRIKIRPDYVPFSGILVDLKSTSAYGENFERQAYNLKYHWSAYLSIMGAEKITGIRHKYYFVVVDVDQCSSVDPKHELSVYECSDRMLDIAQAEVESTIFELCQAIDEIKSGSIADRIVNRFVKTLDAPKFVK